ncbi:hypothetical protein THEYE_A0014 [Thermodesulfovibrio yellowstonii DSM 11347]|uniref:Uncharacterized protein n=1 Tax=Thermodesulfovibrio yellowstonii (strain ATCC 51303 / DSM 11347 / YP87) TaxID=289376 RepID=B5YGT8_THEYD|nr:hypothetical protein THEYE_A0014 [Thermodesulfovibrio yellowstonii DSM 11347]
MLFVFKSVFYAFFMSALSVEKVSYFVHRFNKFELKLFYK